MLITEKVSPQAKAKHNVVVLFDPPSYHYYTNRFFELDSSLNRDNTLRPNWEMKLALERLGYPVFTADMLQQAKHWYPNCLFHYWSLGASAKSALDIQDHQLRKIGVALFEPPLVKPRDYDLVDALAAEFDLVFLHNTDADGYVLRNKSSLSKLRRLDWTNRNYPEHQIQRQEDERFNRVAMIAGAHFRRARASNGYGIRLQALKDCGFDGALDLYGHGWGKFNFRTPVKSLYWNVKLRRNRMSFSAPPSKHEVYSRYNFALCVENMRMTGYVTEKIFDALFSGCIPIYWGAPNIDEYIPADCFVRLDDFGTAKRAIEYCVRMEDDQRQAYRMAMADYLNSATFDRFQKGIHTAITEWYSQSQSQ